MTISAIWAAPVAPMGCPLALSPPEGLTGILPPRLVQPFSAAMPPVPGSKKPEALGGHDLGDREAVVQLDHVHVGRGLARLAVGARRRALGGGHAREIPLVVHEHGVGGGRGAEHPDRAGGARAGDLLGGQHERRAAVGERAAVEELERIGDVGALEHRARG